MARYENSSTTSFLKHAMGLVSDVTKAVCYYKHAIIRFNYFYHGGVCKELIIYKNCVSEKINRHVNLLRIIISTYIVW